MVFSVPRITQIKILICSSSNAACEKIARRLQKGIPDGKNGPILVNMVRMGSQGYKYQDLSSLSVREMAKPYDKHFERIHPGQTPWNSPSSKAVKAMAAECIVFLTTSSNAGSRNMKDLKVNFDVVIVEESAHSFEAQCVIPMGTAAKIGKGRRLHVVSVRNHKQLPPVIETEHAAGLFSTKYKIFFYESLFRSRFGLSSNEFRLAEGVQ